MLKVSTHQQSHQRIKLQSAILLYGTEQANDVVYATVNDVRSTASGLKLGPGLSVSKDGIERALLSISNVTADDLFLSEEVLARTSAMIMWWRRPTMTRVWFKTSELNDDPEDTTTRKFSAIVPLPGLVFRADLRDLCVWAVSGCYRPTASTKLLRSPFFNVWEHGRVCCGNVRFPQSRSPSVIPMWERAFFRSNFTHANVGRLVKYENGASALWRDLLASKFVTFPEEVLISEGKTISEVLNAQFGK